MNRQNFIKKGFIAVLFILVISISGCGAMGSDNPITQMNEAFLPDATDEVQASSKNPDNSPAANDSTMSEENQSKESSGSASDSDKNKNDNSVNSDSKNTNGSNRNTFNKNRKNSNADSNNNNVNNGANNSNSNNADNNANDNSSNNRNNNTNNNSNSNANNSTNNNSNSNANNSTNNNSNSNANNNTNNNSNSNANNSTNNNNNSNSNNDSKVSNKDKNKPSNSSVTNNSQEHKNTEKPSPTKKPQPTPAPTLNQKLCTISIDCRTILNNMDMLNSAKKSFVPENGIILPETSVKLQQGDTVFDILSRVCREREIHLEASYTPGYGTYYVEGIHQLYEFDCGKNLSGWKYFVNGTFINYSASKYKVKAGDRICWSYTCNGGKDLEAMDNED